MRPRRPKNSKRRKAAVDAGFRSAFEAGVAKDLDDRGIKYTYEKSAIGYLKPVRRGECSTCKSPKVGKWCIYTPDFRLGNGHLLELKGRFTSSDRSKLALVRRQHPEIDLRLLFQQDNYTTKLKRQRYSEWADKQGFQWAVGKVVPEEWIT